MKYKILLITHKSPLPIKDGGAYATNNIIEGYLKKKCEIDLLILSTKKHPANKVDIVNKYNTNAYIQNINTKIELIRNLFLIKIPLILKRFYSKKVEETIKTLLNDNKYDFVQLEGLQTTPYISAIKKFSSTKIVYRPHNIEYKIWERLAKNQKCFLSKIFFKIISKSLHRYEKHLVNKYDIIIPLSEIDANFFKINNNSKPIHVCPFGIDIIENQSNIENNFDIFYIGSLDWRPNVEGLEWFINNVWIEIKEKFPEINFFIAGRNPSKKIKQLIKKSKAEYVGEVESSSEFINKHKIMIVPLFAGSGIRVKIIEAMSLGKIIITTPVGIEGIPAEHMKNVIIAENKNEFITYLDKILHNKNFAANISTNAVEFIKNHYDNNKLIAELIEFYQQCLF